MRIGLTYDLREDYPALGLAADEAAEFDSVETVHAIASVLTALGNEIDRIGHLRALTARLARGDRWDLVFNVAEGVSGPAREAQVPALLEGFGIPYTFSDPLTLALALHKGMAKRVARDAGVPTPPFAVVEDPRDLEAVDLRYPLFAKPVAEGSSKGITRASIIGSPAQLLSICRTLMEQYRQPVLIEQFLPGREFTVGVLGTGRDAEVLGVMEVHLGEQAEAGAYSRLNKARFEEVVSYSLAAPPLAEEAASVALAAWRALGCRDAGRVDVRCDADGVVNFLEVNPLAGLAPGVSDLVILSRLKGIEYADLIAMIVERACARLADRAQAPRPDASAGALDAAGR